MDSIIDVTFPGGRRVNAVVGNHIVCSDQAVEDGGEDSAPSPFSLFLASLATCAGITAISFAKRVGHSGEGIAVRLISHYLEAENRYDEITYEVTIPDDFPEKFRAKLVERASNCAVKRHIVQPPEFKSVTIISD